MKRYTGKTLLLLSAILLLAAGAASCVPRAKKADKAIADYLFKTLYDYESYQPVETIVDTAYASPLTDKAIRSEAATAKEAYEKHEKAMEGFNDALETMRIWNVAWDSYSRNKYKEAKDEMDACLAEAKTWLQLFYEKELAIREAADTVRDGMIGWAVTHKYRCKSKGGYALLSEDLFILDPKMKKVLYHTDLDDEDEADITALITAAVSQKPDSLYALIERTKQL